MSARVLMRSTGTEQAVVAAKGRNESGAIVLKSLRQPQAVTLVGGLRQRQQSRFL